ncbi:hypothetical protein EX238_21605 [Providencia rettgeri]|nr:hypothetical protein [Providencia rettgeri]
MKTCTKRLSKSDLIPWLKSLVGATILSISIVGQTVELESNITSPIKLAATLAQKQEWLTDGPYVIEYAESNVENAEDFEYSAVAIAWISQANLKTTKKPVGGYTTLLHQLSDFEYVVLLTKEPPVLTGRLLIALPSDPNELTQLKSILKEYSVGYAFPDGTGTINELNYQQGSGLFHP